MAEFLNFKNGSSHCFGFFGIYLPMIFCENMAQEMWILGTILEYEKDLPDIAGNLLEQSFEYTI